jgi:hypothetical protein
VKALEKYLKSYGFESVKVSELPENTFVCHFSQGDMADVKFHITPLLQERTPGRYTMTVRTPERAYMTYQVIFRDNYILLRPVE